MNTPSLSTVLPSAPASSGPAASFGQNDEINSASPSFSEVLTRQQPAAGQEARATARTDKPVAKPGQQGVADKEKTEAVSGDELALLASEQGLTLPQLALNIAAQAIAPSETKTTISPAAGNTSVSFNARLAPNMAVQSGQNFPAAISEQVITGHARPISGAPVGIPLADLKLVQNAPLQPHQTQTGPGKTTASASHMELRELPRGRLGQPSAGSTLNSLASNAQNLEGRLAGTIGTEAGAGITSADTNANIAQLSAASGAATAVLSQQGLQTAGFSQALPQTISNLAVNTPLQNPQWAADFGRQLVSLTQNGHGKTQTAELRLDPPELGPIRISININDNVAQAIFVSPHAAVRQSVENALPQLQDLLAQAGISLGETNVSDQNQSQEMFDQFAASGAKRSKGSVTVVDIGSGDASAHAATRSKAPDALIDTFA
ncbi:MAG TPA: flagellar hook-length control protein FliK [Eoetvoesiella sp.]